ncbi:MAG: WS/DGAT domain-containing protein [Acidimicrobiia bacterium]|nr:WS/DGAT domain-containing protein [Acidimicrobiia bacterium]
MPTHREREQRFERKMSDAEALMWNIEKDPWLNPNGAMVTILDRPIDVEQLRRRVAYAISKIPRLRERVVSGFGRLSPPTWVTDPEFNLDYHLRHIGLPAPGSVRQLYDLATQLYQDPYDRTRPLWVFTAIDGLEGGRGALFTKLHHSITDGIGAIRLSELYMEAERVAELPPVVDIDQVIADALEAEAASDEADRAATVDSAVKSFGHLWRRQAGIAQRTVGELALWSVDPSRAQDLVEDLVEGAGSAVKQLSPSDGDTAGGSPLWANRSRRRHLESLRLPLDGVKAAGKALGASINDVFVTGAVNGSLLYHDRRDTPVDALNISFVVSTRHDKAIGGNSFTPTPVQVPGGEMTPEERLHEIRDRMAAKRENVSGEGALAGLAGVANLLPTSVVTQVARSQAAKMDFATSNLRAAPFTTYISGAEVTDTITLGPVAGTAFNLTTISYDGSLHLGLFVDPIAVDDPADLADCMLEAYTQLLAAGGVVFDG